MPKQGLNRRGQSDVLKQVAKSAVGVSCGPVSIADGTRGVGTHLPLCLGEGRGMRPSKV